MKLTGAIVAALLLGLIAPAWATGTVRIQQHNDAVATYTGVAMRIVKKTLMLTSADKVSTVVISGGSCAHVNDNNLVRCNGGGMSLEQGGKNYTIPFQNATFYFNLSDQDQMLPLSTMKVGPNSVIFAVKTAKGTYITGDGMLDGEPVK